MWHINKNVQDTFKYMKIMNTIYEGWNKMSIFWKLSWWCSHRNAHSKYEQHRIYSPTAFLYCYTRINLTIQDIFHIACIYIRLMSPRWVTKGMRVVYLFLYGHLSNFHHALDKNTSTIQHTILKPYMMLNTKRSRCSLHYFFIISVITRTLKNPVMQLI